MTQQTLRASKEVEEHKARYARWGVCKCLDVDLEEVKPCKGVTVTSCQVCQKEHGRRYD